MERMDELISRWEGRLIELRTISEDRSIHERSRYKYTHKFMELRDRLKELKEVIKQ